MRAAMPVVEWCAASCWAWLLAWEARWRGRRPKRFRIRALQNAVAGARSRLAVPADHGRRRRRENGWLPATVPGDVHLDLLANKKIPDPFFRDNEAKLQWIEKESWEYRLSFEVTPALLARSQCRSGLRRAGWRRRGLRERRTGAQRRQQLPRLESAREEPSARRQESAARCLSIAHQGRRRGCRRAIPGSRRPRPRPRPISASPPMSTAGTGVRAL